MCCAFVIYKELHNYMCKVKHGLCIYYMVLTWRTLKVSKLKLNLVHLGLIVAYNLDLHYIQYKTARCAERMFKIQYAK